MTIKALILVGGELLATRFRPISISTPKLLFPIAGKPMVGHIVDNLVEQFDTSELEILLVGFFKEENKLKFEAYIKDAKSAYPGLKIKYLSEPYPLGTAGGLYHFKDEIFDVPDCKLLMIHGDVICNYPFKEMLDFYNETQSNITIFGVDPVSLLKKSKAQITVGHYYDDEGQSTVSDDIVTKFGAIVANRKNGKVVHYVEKPSASISAFNRDATYEILLNGGIYIFDRSILELLRQAEVNKSKSIQFNDDGLEDEPDKSVLSLELDVFKTLPQLKSTNFNVYKTNGFWYQLKLPVSALIANNFFLAQGDNNCTDIKTPEIAQPVQMLTKDINLKSSKIGPNVSVGKNVTIGNGVRLVNCIICDDVTIGDHSIIKNAIVSNGTKIGKWCRIEGTITVDTLASNVLDTSASNYLKVSNNIVILCQDTVVKSQVFVYNSIVLPHKDLKEDVKYEIIM
ncbi:putative mannose-1-phosphate guanyltransferase [Candida viswanathii]|uniref:mannose-1-phosphate guanylyltransferase n=1 Tax=Candida viswanathii TaxID=5486 RepID=A0A367YCC4_9ASCO|nr:putative mannose-1-phosphate guanyltransferase [Candida viswanathii]